MRSHASHATSNHVAMTGRTTRMAAPHPGQKAGGVPIVFVVTRDRHA